MARLHLLQVSANESVLMPVPNLCASCRQGWGRTVLHTTKSIPDLQRNFSVPDQKFTHGTISTKNSALSIFSLKPHCKRHHVAPPNCVLHWNIL